MRVNPDDELSDEAKELIADLDRVLEKGDGRR